MMTVPRPWLWIGAVIAGAALALALGVPPVALLIVAAVLACPVAMYFGMRGMGMQQESEDAPMHRQRPIPDPGHPPPERARQGSTSGQEGKPHE